MKNSKARMFEYCKEGFVRNRSLQLTEKFEDKSLFDVLLSIIRTYCGWTLFNIRNRQGKNP